MIPKMPRQMAAASTPARRRRNRGTMRRSGRRFSAGSVRRLGNVMRSGPVRRVAAPDVPIAFSPPLERALLPQVDQVREACRELLAY